MAKEETNVPQPEDEIIEGEFSPSANADEAAAAAAEVDNAADAAAQQEQQLQQLQQELEKAQNQGREYFEGWQRERADFSNYKRRIERDQQMLSQSMKTDVIKKYLTVIDDLERALKTRPTDGPAAAWSNGIELIYRKLTSMLDAEGVLRIPAETEEFNPSRHEAISYEASPDHSAGEIIEVVQQGYTLGDRVIRPALVRVARG
jgi:molecular chaperone GrpE